MEQLRKESLKRKYKLVNVIVYLGNLKNVYILRKMKLLQVGSRSNQDSK